jgi:hypothetical protein
MSHQDQGRNTASPYNHQALKQALDWLLTGAVLSGIKFREDSTWSPFRLIVTALLWAWSDEKTLKDRFFTARKVARRAWGWRQEPATSYQAFTKMLRKWTAPLLLVLTVAFRARMQEALRDRFTVAGYAVFGVDGSRLELPRTESNEARFSPQSAKGRKQRKRKKKGRKASARQRAARSREKKANSPQMWLTTMWHVGSGLPWDWRTGPSDSSERDHLRQMIDSLPPEALVTADAGFVGYDYWKALRDSGRHLLIRVGANVRLLKNLGYVREKNGLVYLWPDKAAAKNQPPLVLRLVVLRTGRHPMYLVTSILDEKQLSDKQVVDIYKQRWGIEIFYRHFKQTFERRKLRSKSADNAQAEADWSLLGLWAMVLHAQHELAQREVPARRISVAGVLRAYRKPMREYKSRPDAGEDFYTLLHQALIDDYQRRSKASRDYPRKKQEHAAGAPQICRATKQQIQKAKLIKRQLELGLTA